MFESTETEQRGWTYVELLVSLKLPHNFLSDLIFRDTQVLPDVAVVAHQGHVFVGDVEQLRQRKSDTIQSRAETLGAAASGESAG